MKSLIALFTAVPMIAFAASTQKSTPPDARDTYSDTSRSLKEAEKQGAATTKTGGSTAMIPDDGSPMTNGGTGVAPQRANNLDANEELRKSGTSSTGGTGTKMDDAGDGSTSNTTGTGSMGSDSGSGKRR